MCILAQVKDWLSPICVLLAVACLKTLELQFKHLLHLIGAADDYCLQLVFYISTKYCVREYFGSSLNFQIFKLSYHKCKITFYPF